MSIARDSFITVIRHILGIGMLLIVQIVLARTLGPEMRGQFAVALTFANILIMFSNFGISNANTYMVADGRLSQSQALGLSLILGVLLSAAGIGLGLWVSGFELEFFEKAQRGDFMFALVMVPPMLLHLYIIGILRGAKRYLPMNISYLAHPVLLCLFVVLFNYGFGWGTKGALLAYSSSAGCCVLINLWFLRKEFDLPAMASSLKNVGHLVSYSVRGFWGDVLSTLNIQVATLILPFFTTPANIGFFAIAVSLVAKLWIIPDSLTLVLMPHVATHKEGLASQVESVLRKVIILSALGAIAMAFLVYPLVLFGFGQEFMQVVAVLLILLPGAIMRGAGKIITGYLLGVDRPGLNSIIKVIGIASNAVLIMIMVSIWGLWGAALATSISYILEGVIYLVSYRAINSKAGLTFWAPRKSDMVYLWNLGRNHVSRYFLRVKGAVNE